MMHRSLVNPMSTKRLAWVPQEGDLRPQLLDRLGLAAAHTGPHDAWRNPAPPPRAHTGRRSMVDTVLAAVGV
jgi:hypothetical protein